MKCKPVKQEWILIIAVSCERNLEDRKPVESAVRARTEKMMTRTYAGMKFWMGKGNFSHKAQRNSMFRVNTNTKDL